MNEVKRAGRISIPFMIKYYLHRLWRILPPYMLVIMFSANLSKYLGTGPVYPKGGFEQNQCNGTWWTNLLFINNFVKTDQMVGIFTENILFFFALNL